MDNNPTWTKKPYILSGYREQNKSNLNYLASIFKIHNESVNIWTHMMGLLYFLYIIFKNNSYNYVIIIYDLTAALCFLLSTIYHVYMPYSANNYLLLLHLDLYSIILNITTSNILVYYYWFWCYENIRNFYMILSMAFY
jgi:adiponectin receptor